MKNPRIIFPIALAVVALLALLSQVSCKTTSPEDVLSSARVAYSALEPVAQIGIGLAQDEGKLTPEQADDARLLLRRLGEALRARDAAQARDLVDPAAEVILTAIQVAVDRGKIKAGTAAALTAFVENLREDLR